MITRLILLSFALINWIYDANDDETDEHVVMSKHNSNTHQWIWTKCLMFADSQTQNRKKKKALFDSVNFRVAICKTQRVACCT